MNETPDSIRPLEMLIEHEEQIGKLYALFGRTFPEARSFWLGLSVEEAEHAQWLRRLGEIMAEGGVSFLPDRFNPRAVETSLGYVQVLLEHASESISMKQALVMAMQIENSMIEQRFFGAYQSKNKDAERILQLLVKETAKHLAWIRYIAEHPERTIPPFA